VQQNMKQFEDARSAVYGSSGNQQFSAEEIGRAAAYEALRTLRESGRRPEPTKVRQQLQGLAEAEAARVIKDKGLKRVNMEQVKKHAAKAAAQLAPQMVGA
jgi:hypothetical protein